MFFFSLHPCCLCLHVLSEMTNPFHTRLKVRAFEHVWTVSLHVLVSGNPLTLESRRSMLSRLLLLWMRPLMRRSDGLPWTVLAEEPAVMEPAVGLGWILMPVKEKAERETQWANCHEQKGKAALCRRPQRAAGWWYLETCFKCQGILFTKIMRGQ